jgi:tRNA-2-methylthio-N6-dimethylallyladenosine synthase
MKYFLETFGCQMNKNDSELMELSMEAEGFNRTSVRDEADVVIVNTCSVREAAESKAFTHIREARGRRRKAFIVIAGCMAQRTAETHIKNGIADIAVGPYETPVVGRIVKQHLLNRKAGPMLHLTQERDQFAPRLTDGLVAMRKEDSWHRFVTITHGCENYCTYCIVPHVRGKLISFSSSEILDHIRKLADQGVLAVTLLGQNVNQYGQDNGEIPFHRLLEQAAQIQGLKRLSFLTSHPKDFNPELVRVIRDNPVISRGIHLPLQSGSDAILKKMNRKYTIAHYMQIIDSLKKELGSDCSITTDLIVGFPGETEEDYQATLDAVRNVGFNEAFTYAYSPREGTAACSFPDSVPDEVKSERLAGLVSLQREFVISRLREMIGSRQRVIIERRSSRNQNDFFGKTHNDISAIVRGNDMLPGTIADIIVTDVKGAALFGNAVTPDK